MKFFTDEMSARPEVILICGVHAIPPMRPVFGPSRRASRRNSRTTGKGLCNCLVPFVTAGWIVADLRSRQGGIAAYWALFLLVFVFVFVFVFVLILVVVLVLAATVFSTTVPRPTPREDWQYANFWKQCAERPNKNPDSNCLAEAWILVTERVIVRRGIDDVGLLRFALIWCIVRMGWGRRTRRGRVPSNIRSAVAVSPRFRIVIRRWLRLPVKCDTADDDA